MRAQVPAALLRVQPRLSVGEVQVAVPLKLRPAVFTLLLVCSRDTQQSRLTHDTLCRSVRGTHCFWFTCSVSPVWVCVLMTLFKGSDHLHNRTHSLSFPCVEPTHSHPQVVTYHRLVTWPSHCIYATKGLPLSAKPLARWNLDEFRHKNNKVMFRKLCMSTKIRHLGSGTWRCPEEREDEVSTWTQNSPDPNFIQLPSEVKNDSPWRFHRGSESYLSGHDWRVTLWCLTPRCWLWILWMLWVSNWRLHGLGLLWHV